MPFLESALTLYYNKIAVTETIDKTWKFGTGAPFGPLEILDIIGIETAYNILKKIMLIPVLILLVSTPD